MALWKRLRDLVARGPGGCGGCDMSRGDFDLGRRRRDRLLWPSTWSFGGWHCLCMYLVAVRKKGKKKKKKKTV
jgi:hypothetical protein